MFVGEHTLREIIREELINEIDISEVSEICMAQGSTHVLNTCYIGNDKFYLKFADPDAEFSWGVDPSLQILIEWLAYRVYGLYGIKIPKKIELVYDKENRRVGLATASISGKSGHYIDPKELGEELSAGVYVDVLLANWDIGNVSNIISDEQGGITRIDPGGSLTFRARGAKKKFTNEPGELSTMISGGTPAAQIFRYSDLRLAAETFNKVRWERIEELLRDCNKEIVNNLTTGGFTELLSQWSYEFEKVINTLEHRHEAIIKNVKFVKHVRDATGESIGESMGGYLLIKLIRESLFLSAH